MELATIGKVFPSPVTKIQATVGTLCFFALFMINVINAPSGIHIVDAATSNPITARAPLG